MGRNGIFDFRVSICARGQWNYGAFLIFEVRFAIAWQEGIRRRAGLWWTGGNQRAWGVAIERRSRGFGLSPWYEKIRARRGFGECWFVNGLNAGQRNGPAWSLVADEVTRRDRSLLHFLQNLTFQAFAEDQRVLRPEALALAAISKAHLVSRRGLVDGWMDGWWIAGFLGFAFRVSWPFKSRVPRSQFRVSGLGTRPSPHG